MSGRSCAAFAAKHLLVSMIGNATRAFTLAKRSLCAVVTSKTTAIGVAVDDLPVLTLLVVISGPKQDASAYVPCSKKKLKRRVAGKAKTSR